MIPKIIHYCWFGKGEKTQLAKKCINTWKKHCPDYEIKEWNEDNFDLDLYPYAREAYKEKKYAFVTDVVRLYALHTVGGVYMDTDVEVLRSLDELLSYKAVSGFESKERISTGFMASVPKLPIVKELLDEYDNIHFNNAGGIDLTTNVVRITKCLKKHGLQLDGKKQTIAEFTLLPQEYLCPKDYDTGEIHLTSNSICIHHFDGSWLPKSIRIKRLIMKLMGKRLMKFYQLTKNK